jgi:protein O-mannosyl-transferase
MADRSVQTSPPGSNETAIAPANRAAIGYLAIAAVALAAFWPSLHAGFIWNDDSFLTENPLIKAPDGLYRFWLTQQAPDYWPLTCTTLWVEWRLWGVHAAGYHLTNLLLHVLSVALLWRILRRLLVPGALFGALLFAVHPVNVESVAWITQRKNLMAMVCFLASIYCFLRTTWASPPMSAQPDTDHRRGWYALSLAAFALAMLSKGSVALLPAVLIGLICWRRRFSVRDGVRLLPFWMIAVAFTAVNMWFQAHCAGTTARPVGLVERSLGAGAVVWFYLGKALLPVHLCFFYPQWFVQAGNPLWWIPLIATILATFLLWRWSRPGFFTWVYFGLMLAPVMGFTDVYYMRYSLVADHYQHLALIGVTSLAGAALWHFSTGRLRLTLAAIILAASTWLTARQCGFYHDDATLYRATLQENPDSALAHNNLGNLLMNAGHVQEAIGHFEQAVRLDPGFAEAQNDLGAALVARTRLPEAIIRFREALRVRPDFAEAHYNLGFALRDSGDKQEALFHFEEAVRLWPTYIKALNALGLALYDAGKNEAAVACYEQALRINSNYPDILSNLGCAFLKMNRLDEAIARFEQARRLDSNLPDLPYNLGVAFARAGRLEESIAQFEQTVRLQPDNTDARLKLAAVLWRAGRRAEATAQRDEALRRRNSLTAHGN